MSTWDSMSDDDYAACVDAGRGPTPDPREVADLRRKEAQERSWWSPGIPVWVYDETHDCDVPGEVIEDWGGLVSIRLANDEIVEAVSGVVRFRSGRPIGESNPG